MKVEIKNFGPIEILQFDLDKDLHLIYGENAIGKSYATYCLYCLLKNIKSKKIPYYTFRNESNSHYNTFIKNVFKQLKKEKQNLLITDDFRKLLENDLSDILLKTFQNSLLITFSSLKNLRNGYTKRNFEITVFITNTRKLRFYLNDNNTFHLDFQTNYADLEILEKNTKSTHYSLYNSGKKIFGKPTEEEFITEFAGRYTSTLNSILSDLDSNLRDIYYLPASRSGLYQALNAFTPILAELTQNRFFLQNKNIELPSLPEPLSDYFLDLSTVDVKNLNKDFKPIYSDIENNLLKGAVNYDEKSKKIIYKPKDLDLELNLSESSSMVSELSPLVLYLKYILNHKFQSTRNSNHYYEPFYTSKSQKNREYDILFIEEPEAHLHPKVQIALMEIFAKLATYKLKIFITSHSNYMFNKLNNLIIQKKIDSSKIAVYHLVMGKNGTKQQNDMPITEEGIIDENFQSASEELYYERMNSFEENVSQD